MPLYEFKCNGCGHEFEDLTKYEDRDRDQKCKLCGALSTRKWASVFGIHSELNPKRDTIVSPKEIDKVVGKLAAEKWEGYDARWKSRYKDRQEKRWKGKTPEPINIPKDVDGKYSPILHLGNKKQRVLRKEYSEALKEHRADRESKGIKQFDSPGFTTED